MARPNSRYFAPVIKKLLEAKRQESIVIDQNLKANLRANILTKAGGTALQTGQGFDFGRFIEGAIGIFGKFRYQLAVVPSLLLLVIVAVSAMRMPVNIKSDVLVPVVTPQQKADNTFAQVESVQVNSAQTDSAQPGLKTFAGRSVLPSSYFEKAPEKIQFNTDLLLSEPAYVEPVNVQAPKIVSASAPATPVLPAPRIYYYVPEELQNEEPVVTADVTEVRNLPQVQVTNDALRSQAELPNPAQTEAAQKSTASDYVRTEARPELFVMQAVPARQILPIYYNSDFSEDEKTVFEQDVVAGLVADKDVSYVSISIGSDRVVSVEVYFNDGSKELKYFRKGADSNAWNQVKYVENYYYDDSLRYEPSMHYVDYNTYDYPYEY